MRGVADETAHVTAAVAALTLRRRRTYTGCGPHLPNEVLSFWKE
jgi:hypothetical protein